MLSLKKILLEKSLFDEVDEIRDGEIILQSPNRSFIAAGSFLERMAKK